jgi:NitT/TauT family transport system permease protein
MIGLSPRVLKIFQPVVQIVASFPSSMLFPIMIAFFAYLKISLAIGSVLLMLLATQWYILFNVIAGASMIPSELREASAAFNMNRWQTFKSLYFPSILPHLVTGCLTAAGAAWNASIVCEYVTLQNQQISTFGLGSVLSLAGANGNGSQLAAATLVLATTVVLFNRLVWKRLYELAETRYSLIK